MRPSQVLTYAVLGLASSVTAQVDSSPDSNDLVAREPFKPYRIVPVHGTMGKSVRSEDGDHDLATRSKFRIRPTIKAPTHAGGRLTESSRRAGMGLRLKIARSLSADDDHDLATRSKFRIRPAIKAPTHHGGRLTESSRRMGLGSKIALRSVSEDDENYLATRSPRRMGPSTMAPSAMSGRRMGSGRGRVRSVGEDGENNLATRSPGKFKDSLARDKPLYTTL